MTSIKVKAMAVVSREDGSILATLGHDSVKNETFARLPGGHVEFQETAEVALRREFMEEFGAELKNVEFLRIIENIFTHLGEPGHEVVFIYRAEFVDPELYVRDQLIVLDKPTSVAYWIPLTDLELGKIRIYPEGFAD